jgi:multidrug efflux system membrane fusion protein
MKRAAIVALLLACGCHAQKDAAPDAGAADAGAGTPVKVARVVKATLSLTAAGPGQTDALEQQKIRAPYKGVLLELRVADGDHVKNRQVVAVMVAQESAAAVVGARSLLRAASTPQQKRDARRALQLAERGVVRTELRAPEAGVVVSHGADEGSLLAEAQDLISLAATDSFVFRAQLVQTALPSIHPGQPAQVTLPGQQKPLAGKVHAILPAASPTDLTAPVRIDLDLPPHALGLFGTARITVAEHRDVPVVPDAAVLRDDINGTTRVATVTDQGKAHWETVKVGAEEAGRTEIVQPALAPGTMVIVEGQVGLPEGAPVQVGQ